MNAGKITIKVSNPRHFINGLYSFCIGLLPVLYLLGIPGLNISLGTIILLGFTPYSLYHILKGINIKSKVNCFLFLLFYVYLIFRADGNTTRIIMCCAAFINLYGMMKGSIQTERIRAIVEMFSLINVFLLVLQVISYYILHFRLQLIPQNIIYEEYRNSYVFNEVAGIYRPSALFFEPSHFSQYCIFALISVLFPARGEANIKKALAIGLGCILTTSGMGIAMTFGVFAWYMVLNRQRINKKIFTIIKWSPVLLIVIFFLSRTEFFQIALQRVFSTVDNYNAISGRTHNWNDTVGNMHGQTLWLGYGDSKTYKWYLTGLADSIYKYGIISVLLQGLCLLQLMIKKVDNFVWCCCIVFAGLFCVAHLTNFVAQVFYFGIVIIDVITPKTKAVM